MNVTKFHGWLFLAGIIIVITGCKPKLTDHFEGYVVNFKNEGLEDAEVEINGIKTKTKKDGLFILELERSKQNVFQVNARKDGYATYSQPVSAPSKNLKLMLYEATVVSVDPTKEIKVTDTNSKNRPGPLVNQANWASDPFTAVPLVMRNGKIVDIGFPAGFDKAFDYLLNRKPGEGISITIPANSLVSTSSQNVPTGNVNVAISTIDLFSPNAMPGDFSLTREGREAGYLISYGAGFIDIYDNKDRYQLKKGATAQITIPVDESQLVLGDSLPASIPLFLFDEKTGTWVDHGKASLDKDKKAYTGEVRHFSTFNLDIEKNTPACLGFQYTPSVAAPAGFSYQVEVLASQGGNIVHRTRTITEPGDCLANATYNTGAHVLLRLPPAADIGLIFVDNTNTPMAIIITQSSPDYGVSTPPTCTAAGYENAGGVVSCPSIAWDKITTPIIAVGITTGSVQQVKWVYKDFATSGAVGYRIVAADGSCVPTNTTNLASSQTNTVLALSGLTLVQADLPAGSTGNFKVQALSSTNTVLAESACVTF